MFFEDIFGGGMPGGHQHMHRGAREEADTQGLYDILGVEKTATDREIKKAWRKATKTHHPDRGGDPEVFKNFENANSILADPEKRRLYDQGGLQAVQAGRSGGPGDIFDLFGGHGRQQQRGPSKPPPIRESLTITLEDVFQGGERQISVTILTAEEQNTCSRCQGRGSVMETVRRGPMILQSQRECSKCNGKGISYANERRVTKELTVYIEPGIKDGDKQTLDYEGHQLPEQPHGDVIVTFHVKTHPLYKRIQADLACQKEITLVQALCGFSYYLKSLEEQTFLEIRIPSGTVVQPDDVIKIAGKGLPQKGSGIVGNLFIKFKVVLPSNNSIGADALTQLRSILSPDSVQYIMPNTANDNREIETGCNVRLTGLTNRPDLNGTAGKVIEANIRQGAHAVRLVTGQTVSVRAELLEMTDPIPVQAEEQPDSDDMIDRCTGEIVDLETQKHTPAACRSVHDADSDEEGDGVQCRPM